MGRKTVLLSVDDDATRGEKQAELVCDLFDAERIEAVVHHNFAVDDTEATLQDLESVRVVHSILEEAGVEVTLHETTGKNPVAIVDTAEQFDVDTICLYARRRSPTGKILFGSTAQDVILSTDRSILLAPK